MSSKNIERGTLARRALLFFNAFLIRNKKIDNYIFAVIEKIVPFWEQNMKKPIDKRAGAVYNKTNMR